MSEVYLGLGSNLGDRVENIKDMLAGLEEEAKLIQLSSIYETVPVGYLNQPTFLNAVCLIETEMTPDELLSWIKKIETGVGPGATFRNGPRYADIDILLVDNLVLETPRLAIPHPRLVERAFVLVPLVEIAPNLLHPVLNLKMSEVLGRIERPWGVKKLPAQVSSD